MAQPDPYKIVSDSIIAMLEEGVAPWRKPWVASGYRPTSLSTNKAYQGVNYWVLSFQAMNKGYESPYWGTFKQIAGRGGQVRTGSKGTAVVLWRRIDDKRPEPLEDGTYKQVVFMTYFTVFNAEQVEWPEGTEPKYEKISDRPVGDRIEAAQSLLDAYIGRDGSPELIHGEDRAYYSPSRDIINLPPFATFLDSEGYYATAFHECGHSTGHSTRLSRDGVIENHRFGDALYSKEELVAEFTAAFLSSETGIAPAVLENSAAYVKNWLLVLKNERKELLSAISEAQKAANYILDGPKKEGD